MNTLDNRTLKQRCLDSLRGAAGQWTSFWFTPEDPLMLGVMRVLTGWMLLYNLLVWALDLRAFFGTNGLLPQDAIRELYQHDFVVSFMLSVSDKWLLTVHGLCVAIALMFMLGIATRVTSVAAFLITISYSQRVPVANFGLDQILGMMCLYLAVGPSGDSFSLDAWWKNRKAELAGLLPTDPQPSRSARVAMRLIQLHLCAIYFWAGFAKLKGATWWSGEAMWQVIANEEYQTIDLTWMAWIPWLPFLIAHITVAWEVFFCILIWNPRLRPLMLVIGTAMHLGIGAFLGMWTFGLIMTFAYLSFTNPAAWRLWLAQRGFMAAEDREGVYPSSLPKDPVVAAALVDDDVDDEPLDLLPPHSPIDLPAASSTSTLQTTMNQALSAQILPSQPPAAQTLAAQTLPSQVPVANVTSTSSRSSELQTSDSGGAYDSTLAVLGLSATGVMIVSSQPAERNTLRRYFRMYDIPCRAVATAENALSIATMQKPCAVIVSGIQMTPDEVATLVEDLVDLFEFPVIALISQLQHHRLSRLSSRARVLHYPTSPELIRNALQSVMFGETDRSTDDIAARTFVDGRTWQQILGHRSDP